jgi:hypothetical protein
MKKLFSIFLILFTSNFFAQTNCGYGDKNSHEYRSGSHDCELHCRRMSEASFIELYNFLCTLPFDQDRFKDATRALKRGSFSSKQIRTMLAVFSYESNKLEFAKYAFDYVYDQGAYAIVKLGFGNYFSGKELDDFLDSKYEAEAASK